MQNEIRQVRHLHKPPKIVWDYLTKPELIEQWLGKSDFKPIVGHKFRIPTKYGDHCICVVTEVKPHTKLSYSWQKDSAKDGLPFHSTVEWTLVPTDYGTELHLVHHGFRTPEDLTQHENGWNYCHKQFENLLNAIKYDGANA